MQNLAVITLFGFLATSSMATMLRMNTTQLRGGSEGLVRTNYGKDGCHCVGIDNMKGYYATTLDFYHIEYPLEAGASCGAWENSYHPKCQESPAPRWCKQEWCYIDPCSCNLEDLPKQTYTKTEFQGKDAYWSYATCGYDDFWTGEDPEACVNQKTSGSCANLAKCAWDGKQCGGKEVVQHCEHTETNAVAVHGEEDCSCVGLGGKTKGGFALMHINDTHQVEYNPNVGSTCGAWEMDAHPECKHDGEKPSWCSQKWCFVDPCKCKSKIPPRTVMTANQYMRFQGKTAYWSYDTCGSKDTWSTSHAGDYCVTQKSEAECSKLSSKCSWNGKECLGKALVELCEKQQDSGNLGMESPLPDESGAFSFKPLMPILATFMFFA